MTAAVAEGLELRDAVPGDNASLLELTAACAMQGDIALRMDRAPDFFALNRLEGESSRVGVVTDDSGQIVGSVAAARRRAFVNGNVTAISYVSDLKVHPRARGSGAADLLTRYVRDAAADLVGPNAPVMLSILAGNTAMERRARGPRGAPVLSRFATISVLAIPLLWERREKIAGLTVRNATSSDYEAMVDLWRREAPQRQFAADLTEDDLRSFIDAAPGLSITDYLLAFDPRGRLRGFVGVWDQTSFKQMRVVSYSPRLAVARKLINIIAPMTGAPPLPQPGGALPALAAVHVCADEAPTLRALLLSAYRRHRAGRFTFLTIGLDVRDPLLRATEGLIGQPTRVNAYVTTAAGSADPDLLSRRPLHFEPALV